MITLTITGETSAHVLRAVRELSGNADTYATGDAATTLRTAAVMGAVAAKEAEAAAAFDAAPLAERLETIDAFVAKHKSEVIGEQYAAPHAPTAATVAKLTRTRKKAEPASTEPTELDKQEAAVPLPAPKIDDVRAAMKALAQSKMPDMNAGTTLVEAVLRQFGVMKASDVPDAERANFIAECAKKAAG